MRKKFTLLFVSLLAFAGVAKAGVTDLPEMSTEGDIKWYTIKNVRKQKFATYAGDDATMTQNESPSAASFFYFTASTTEGAVKIHNFAAGENLCAAYNSWTATGIDWYLKAQGTGVSICTSTGEWNAWNDAGGGGQKIEYWSASDAGSAWEISLVTDFSSIINVPAAKDAAKTELDNFAKISALFSDATQAKADVDAVEAAGTGLAELNAAVGAINAVVLAYKKQINGKNVRFTTYGRNTTDGHDMTAVAAGGTGTTKSADAGIWTLTSNEDGTFKMYNFVSNLYLGGTKGASQHVPTCESFADAAPYTFNVIEENTVNLLNNGNTLHLDGWANVVQWNDNSAGASIWEVVSCNPIVVTREQYDAAAAAKETLPYAIQQAYGLVTDAANYYSNWKSEAEGSYEALLDNAATYFHSAYTDEAKAEDAAAHYIQANFESAVGEFYFYMAPRNANNRPVNITVSGSNDNETFEEIKQISTTLASTSSYFSEKLGTAGKSYKHIRLTVTSTNTGTKFFTLSELYFLSAEADVTSLIDSYKAFASSSITSESMATAATALINAEGTLALSNLKKEVAALLSANESNHAATPALGQYTTEAYNALNAAYTAADATQESLEAAIAAFKATLNMPVYFITSAWDEGYPAGSAIYYDGAWKWKAANKYDKQMWMTIPGYTKADVPVVDAYDANGTSYAICDYLTGTKMRGKDVQIVKIANWEGAYNLQYNADATSTDAVQHANGSNSIVNWKAATTTDCKASAWRVEYMGASYDLAKLTDEHIEALSSLQTVYDANKVLANATFGTELGQYSGNREAIIAALASAEAIFAKNMGQLATMEISALETIEASINDAAASISYNKPVDGKYYRIMAVAEWNDDARYLGSKNSTAKDGRAEFVAEADANTIFLYKDGYLKNYATGLYLVNNSDFLGYNVEQAVGSKIDFHAASNGLSGAYNISFNGGSRWLYCHQSNYTDAGGRGTQNGYCFNLVEVTELPVLGVALDQTTATIVEKQTLQLIATVTPDHATSKTVTWSTSNDKVATVDENGVVTAITDGQVTITATAGDKTAECAVTVTKASYTFTLNIDGVEHFIQSVQRGTELATIMESVEKPEDREGYTFSGWTLPDVMPAEHLTLDATYIINSYTVTFKIGEEVIYSEEMEYGAAIEAPEAPEKTGYTFNGWGEVAATVPVDGATYEGSYSVNKYKVIFQIGEEVIYSEELEYGAAIEAPEAPEKTGYTFNGWGEVAATVPVDGATYEGSYTVNKYTVIFKIGEDVISSEEMEYGATIVAPEAPAKEGYTFSGWGDVAETVPAEAVTYEGSYTVNKYTVTFKIGEEVIYSAELEYGATIVAPEAPAKEGYTFSGWGDVAETVPAEAVTYEGAYSVNKYKVCYIINGEVVFEHEVEYGAAIEIPEELEAMYPGFEWIGEDPEEVYETMPAFDIAFNGNDVTGLDRLSIDSNAVIYDIHGRRVLEMTKGLYIVNGKKVLVK
jgi:hypothetical protein